MGITTRANISPGYRWRPGLFGLAAIVFGLWFAYDGWISYPRDNVIHEAVQRYKIEYGDRAVETYNDTARRENWPRWIDREPGKKRTGSDMMTQRVLGMFCMFGGLLGLIAYARTFGRWIAIDDQGIVTSWGQRANVDQITELDLDRWDSKGIAVVHYHEGQRRRRLVLDDWKYDRTATTAMVDRVKTQLHVEK